MLKVVPGIGMDDRPAQAELAAHPRDEVTGGTEIVLHGWMHRSSGPPRGPWFDRWRATAVAEGSAVLMGIDAQEAGRRLRLGPAPAPPCLNSASRSAAAHGSARRSPALCARSPAGAAAAVVAAPVAAPAPPTRPATPATSTPARKPAVTPQPPANRKGPEQKKPPRARRDTSQARSSPRGGRGVGD